MTTVDIDFTSDRVSPITGRLREGFHGAFRLLASGGTYRALAYEGTDELGSSLSPLEANLRDIQSAITAISMHLPKGFAVGLKTQFANMLDPDEWDSRDKLISTEAVNCFLVLLIHSRAQKRPGIGTNGKGAVSAFWRSGTDRLTVSCHPTGEVTWVISYTPEDGEPEKAAGTCKANRLLKVLAPFEPERWFDQ